MLFFRLYSANSRLTLARCTVCWRGWFRVSKKMPGAKENLFNVSFRASFAMCFPSIIFSPTLSALPLCLSLPISHSHLLDIIIIISFFREQNFVRQKIMSSLFRCLFAKNLQLKILLTNDNFLATTIWSVIMTGLWGVCGIWASDLPMAGSNA